MNSEQPIPEKVMEIPVTHALDIYSFLGSDIIVDRFHLLSPSTRDKILLWRKILKEEICK